MLRHTVVSALACLLVFNVVCKLAGYVWLRHTTPNIISNIYPWAVNEKEVLLQFDIWTRYKLHSADEWAALVPGNGIVHLGEEPHTVSMLHQLRCLDIVRAQLTVPKPARTVDTTRHCLNYLRQILACHADDMLDSYQYVHKIHALNAQPVRRCRDWRAVYERVERAQRGHDMALSRGNGTGRT